MSPVIKAQEEDLKNLSVQQKITLSGYLLDLAHRFDCYFTFEEVYNSSEANNQLGQLYIQDFGVRYRPQAEVRDLEASLEELQKSIPHFTFKVNANNSHVIHIMDARLIQQENYPLNNSLNA